MGKKKDEDVLFRVARGFITREELGLEEENAAVAAARRRAGDNVLRAMNGDISKLVLRTSGGVLGNASLEDDIDETTKVLHATLYPPDAEPLHGYWNVQVDDDGFVWLQRLNDDEGQEGEHEVFDVFGVGCLQ